MNKLAFIILSVLVVGCAVEDVSPVTINNNSQDNISKKETDKGSDDTPDNGDPSNTPSDGNPKVIISKNDFPNSSNEALALLVQVDTTEEVENSSKEWMAEGFEIQGISGFQNCRLDDMITLNGDGTYDYDGGSNLCGAEDDEKIKDGTWELDFDNKLIIVNKGTGSEFSLIIESFDGSEIVFSGTYLGLTVTGQFTTNN